MIDAALAAALRADSGVEALVSTRVYPDELPVGCTLPAISYRLVSDVPDPVVPGYRTARVQVSVWSGTASPLEASTVAEAVISAIGRSRLGDAPRTWTAGSTSYTVVACRSTNAPRLREPDSKYWHRPCDFLVTYRT